MKLGAFKSWEFLEWEVFGVGHFLELGVSDVLSFESWLFSDEFFRLGGLGV